MARHPKMRFKRPDGTDYPDWQVMRLGDITSIKTGNSNREDSTETGQYHFFDRSTDIRASSKYLFDTQAIIVGGEGKDFIPKYFVGKFDLHQRAYAITDFKQNDGRFIYYYIYHNRRYFLKMSVGSTMPSLRMNAFTTFPINLPHPDEQQRIAAFLSNLDAVMTAHAQKVEYLKQYKKYFMQNLFPQTSETTPKIRFRRSDSTDYPDWQVVRLGDICSKGSSNLTMKDVHRDAQYYVYGASGICGKTKDFISNEKYIAIVKDGAVGKLYLCEKNTHILATLQKITHKENHNLLYIYYVMQTINFDKYVTGSAIPHIYYKDYSKEKIYLPHPDEQQKIVAFFSNLDDVITAYTQKVEYLKQYKKSLMQNMFI